VEDWQAGARQAARFRMSLRLASAGCGTFFDEPEQPGTGSSAAGAGSRARGLETLPVRAKEAIYQSLNHHSNACTGRGQSLCPTTTGLWHPGPWLHRPNAGPATDLRNPDPRRRIHVSNAGAATDVCDSEPRWRVHPAAIRLAARVHAPAINRASVLKVGIVSLIWVYSAAGKDGVGRASNANSPLFWKAGEGPEPCHNRRPGVRRGSVRARRLVVLSLADVRAQSRSLSSCQPRFLPTSRSSI
jgi:hypothetical protein